MLKGKRLVQNKDFFHSWFLPILLGVLGLAAYGSTKIPNSTGPTPTSASAPIVHASPDDDLKLN